MAIAITLLMIMFFCVIGMITSLAGFRFLGEKTALNLLIGSLIIFLSVIVIFILSITLDIFGSLGDQVRSILGKSLN